MNKNSDANPNLPTITVIRRLGRLFITCKRHSAIANLWAPRLGSAQRKHPLKPLRPIKQSNMNCTPWRWCSRITFESAGSTTTSQAKGHPASHTVFFCDPGNSSEDNVKSVEHTFSIQTRRTILSHHSLPSHRRIEDIKKRHRVRHH